jgi:two-component system response regulator YesN
MKILIADDEPLVRIGIKSSYGWKEAGMEIVGEAADGEEALRLIEELKPDVVILDIKMPKKDGIEVLSAMRERGSQAKVIILSSFDDFVHVKKAMQLGAFDYFHKPSMNIQEIIGVLKKLQQDVKDKISDAEMGGSRPGKEVIVREMIGGRIERARETKLKESSLYVVLFTVKRFEQMLKRYTLDSAAFLPSTIYNMVCELLSKEQETELAKLEENMFAVILSHSDSLSSQASFAHVNDVVYLIHSSLKRFLNIEPVFGISEAFHTFREVQQGTDQAKQALEMKFYNPNDPLFYYRNRKIADDDLQERITASILSMKDSLKDEKFEQFAASLTEWEQLVQNHEWMSEKDVKKVYEGLWFMMAEGEDIGVDSDKMRQLDDFVECSVFYHALFNEKLKDRIIGKNKDYSPLIRNVIQFIDSQYKEDISLKLLGDTFHSSPNYISRLFKQEVGRGVFDYLNVVRIRQAKELLKGYTYKIYEISEMVGFKSQVHFAIVFNKYEGMSPTDYRKEIG